jgi:uncharacterized protein Usg
MLTTKHTINVPKTEGFGLTTAQIIYHLPDYHNFLQEFIWQKFDIYPEFPALGKFLGFWVEKIEGPIHSVTVAHALLIKPREVELSRKRLMLN